MGNPITILSDCGGFTSADPTVLAGWLAMVLHLVTPEHFLGALKATLAGDKETLRVIRQAVTACMGTPS